MYPAPAGGEGRAPWRSSGPGCTSGRRRATWRSRPCRGASSPSAPAIGALIVGIVLAIMVPRIDATRRRTPPRTPRSGRKVRKESDARITRAQRATLGRGEGAHAGRRRAPAPRLEAAKGKLMRRCEADMYADAKARGASGEIKPVTAPPECERAPGTPTTRRLRRLRLLHADDRDQAQRAQPGRRARLPVPRGRPLRHVHVRVVPTEPIPGEKLVVDAASRRRSSPRPASASRASRREQEPAPPRRTRKPDGLPLRQRTERVTWPR